MPCVSASTCVCGIRKSFRPQSDNHTIRRIPDTWASVRFIFQRTRVDTYFYATLYTIRSGRYGDVLSFDVRWMTPPSGGSRFFQGSTLPLPPQETSSKTRNFFTRTNATRTRFKNPWKYNQYTNVLNMQFWNRVDVFQWIFKTLQNRSMLIPWLFNALIRVPQGVHRVKGENFSHVLLHDGFCFLITVLINKCKD